MKHYIFNKEEDDFLKDDGEKISFNSSNEVYSYLHNNCQYKDDFITENFSIMKATKILSVDHSIRLPITEQPAADSKNRKPGIYIASKTNHADKWIKLREEGLNVISTWIDEAGKGKSKNKLDLCNRCIKESVECDVMIVYREEGEYLKGAFVEMGAAMSANKFIYFVGPVLAEGSAFTHYQFLYQCSTIEEALHLIGLSGVTKTVEQPSPTNLQENLVYWEEGLSRVKDIFLKEDDSYIGYATMKNNGEWILNTPYKTWAPDLLIAIGNLLNEMNNEK